MCWQFDNVIQNDIISSKCRMPDTEKVPDGQIEQASSYLADIYLGERDSLQWSKQAFTSMRDQVWTEIGKEYGLEEEVKPLWNALKRSQLAKGGHEKPILITYRMRLNQTFTGVTDENAKHLLFDILLARCSYGSAGKFRDDLLPSEEAKKMAEEIGFIPGFESELSVSSLIKQVLSGKLKVENSLHKEV